MKEKKQALRHPVVGWTASEVVQMNLTASRLRRSESFTAQLRESCWTTLKKSRFSTINFHSPDSNDISHLLAGLPNAETNIIQPSSTLLRQW